MGILLVSPADGAGGAVLGAGTRVGGRVAADVGAEGAGPLRVGAPWGAFSRVVGASGDGLDDWVARTGTCGLLAAEGAFEADPSSGRLAARVTGAG